MKARVKLPKALSKEIDGEGPVEVSGNTVLECLEGLTRRYPRLNGVILDAEGRVPLKWMVYVNGELASSEAAYSRAIAEGDTIGLIPLVAGG